MENLKIPPGTFIPPLRFAVVEPHLYRGSYPRPLNLGFLESLKLKTIISLTPEPLSQDIQRWAHSHDISLVHFAPVKGSKKEAPLDNSEATKVVELALNPENAPMYIHCLNGSEVTSIAICALRKLQFWSHPVIFSEMIRFSDIHSYSERFLENFGGVDTGVDIVIPKRRVAWLWQGLVDEKGKLPEAYTGLKNTAWAMNIRYEDEQLEAERVAIEEKDNDTYEMTRWRSGVNGITMITENQSTAIPDGDTPIL